MRTGKCLRYAVKPLNTKLHTISPSNMSTWLISITLHKGITQAIFPPNHYKTVQSIFSFKTHTQNYNTRPCHLYCHFSDVTPLIFGD